MNPRHPTAWQRTGRSDPGCPICGNAKVTTSWKHHVFTYGSEKTAVDLSVNVPARRCDRCEFEYLDESAERLRHEAVCKHLGVLPPEEIREIRKHHRMTRARFAETTGLGEASLNRWENGLSIQTHANDRYLRLLAYPAIMRTLEALATPETRSQSHFGSLTNRFKVLKLTDTVMMHKESFRLRKAA